MESFKILSGLFSLWPLRSVLTVIRDFRGTKDLCASPMYVGMQDGQSARNSDQTNKQTNTYDITLREHTSMMSDSFGHFLLPSPLNVRFFGAILDPLPPKL